ncbi:3-dehydroquinate synthase [hydrothermal vent metagenome]|uniref:3-dehydroquinate synthase n=1 Tax=hydrothermal vent metagenome TaxID=652676 RepID=A0A3B1CD61_9ZZZZ
MAIKERVRLGSRSYDIFIGPDVLTGAGGAIAPISKRALVVTNRRVYGLHGRKLTQGLDKAGVRWEALLLPDGERYKNMAAVEKIHDRLIKGRYDRDTVIVAFGGGVTGDIAGFAAATYMRGIKLAQAPTTLLSQVDSSVGGKTGVNHPRGKNLIGAFYQPGVVLADISALKTLPDKEIRCGVAEVIKYGLIASAKFFKFLEGAIEALTALEPGVTLKVVRRSCRIKADVVAEDEKESGKRAILNFGHTVGHAIEAVTRYRRYKHGYAVAMGMVTASILSEMKGGLKAGDVGAITSLISKAGLPVAIPKSISDKELYKAMKHDKKVKAGSIRFALLDTIGHCEINSNVSEKEICEALRRSRHV